jgi:hypothetical protein
MDVVKTICIFILGIGMLIKGITEIKKNTKR